MKKILLTSGGLSPGLQKIFLEQIGKEANDIKVIFVPTAAMYSDNAKEYISLIMYYMNNMGILSKNIFMYHLGYLLSKDYNPTYLSDIPTIPSFLRLLSAEEMNEFDVLFFLGGEAIPLLDEINRTGFNEIIHQAIKNGMFYIGASAGSMIAAGNLQNGLGYVKNHIEVHCEKGTPCGDLPKEGTIYLTDAQAIWINGDVTQIIE